LRKLKTYLRRVIGDIARKIARDTLLKPVFAQPLSHSYRVLTRQRRQKAPKSLPPARTGVYSLHAPEVECIGGANVYRERQALTRRARPISRMTSGSSPKAWFGVKVSFATAIGPSKGGQFILHAKALPGNPGACPRARRSRDPGDGHTLESAIPGI
jgi:transposase, IS5 family